MFLEELTVVFDKSEKESGKKAQQQLQSSRWELRRDLSNVPSNWCDKWGTLLAQCFWARGFSTEEEIEKFLFPKLSQLETPFRLKNLEQSAERILKAFEKNQKITIYADYDVDGMSACSLLYTFFKDCGAEDVHFYIPHRFLEGYGVHTEAVEKIAAGGTSLMITVDNGITAVEAVARARELGLDVILTDHHLPKEVLPNTEWLINPNSGLDQSGLNYLCGCGVAFYLCMGLLIKAKEKNYFQSKQINPPKLKEYLDFFTLATLADQMLLVGENRCLVKAGLEELKNTKRPGLKVLLQACLNDPSAPLTARNVNFGIVPKLNAASRLGEAEKSLSLLMSDNWKDAEENCAHLLSLNEKRVGLQDEVWTQAQSQCEEQMEKGFPVLIVRGEWHEGVLGIVASKVVEKYYRPSIVLNSEKEVLKGSMRSTKGFHCVKLLEASAKYLKTFGGHEQAAGLQLLDLHFELFQESICSFAKDYLSKESLAERVIVYDAQWNLAEGVSEKDFLNLESFAPYGPGNSEVLLLVKNVTLPKNYKILKEKHIKWSGPNGLEFVAFGKVKEILNCSDQANKAIDILVTPEINRFRGSSRLQCRIEHVRPCITENTFS